VQPRVIVQVRDSATQRGCYFDASRFDALDRVDIVQQMSSSDARFRA